MRRRSIVVVVATATAVLVPVAPAHAAPGGTRTGVWSQLPPVSPGGPVPLLPGDFPEGGLWLNTDPTSDRAVSALRIDVEPESVPTRLTLRVAGDRSTPALAMTLCPPAKPWNPPKQAPGPWEERPVSDCSVSRFDGRVSDDGERVEFTLSGYRPGQVVDLVLTRPPGAGQSVIDVTFEKPSMSDVVLGTPEADEGDDSRGGGSGTGADPAAAPTSDPQPGFTSGSLSEPPPLTDFAAPRLDAPGASAADPVVAGAGGQAPRVGTGTRLAADEADRPAKTWDTGRRVALGILVALCLWIAAIVSRGTFGGASRSFTLYRGTPTS